MEKGSKKKGGERFMIKHYPWLAKFDEEVKARLITPDVANIHVLKLITLLESNISSEVSKLRNKPNRATKLLTQIRKRVCLAKVGSYMTDSATEKDLFPTYGLLMKHVVDLTLVSSQITKYGVERVASDLYYLLRLMFHGDNQYLLDVILCSTLDEHASSKNEVGFQLFSLVVEDYRCFAGTHSRILKYCAVASLLFHSNTEGRIIVERNLPTTVDKSFIKYFKDTLAINLKEHKSGNNKVITYRDVVKIIRVNTVKSICRNRLVIVSKRNITKTVGGHQQSFMDRDTDEESNSSTVVNVPSSSALVRQSSSCTIKVQEGEDPLSQILGDLGILDSCGDGGIRSRSMSGSTDDEARVSSSTYKHNANQNDTKAVGHVSDYVKMELESCDEEDPEDYDNLERLSGTSNDRAGRRPNSLKSKKIKVSQTKPDPVDCDISESDEVVSENEADGDPTGIDSDQIESEEENDKVENEVEMAHDNDSEETVESEDLFAENEAAAAAAAGESLKKPEEDSDLEILSVKSSDHISDLDPGLERDEAEAESGEDDVPNYDESSDEDKQGEAQLSGTGNDDADNTLKFEPPEDENKDKVQIPATDENFVCVTTASNSPSVEEVMTVGTNDTSPSKKANGKLDEEESQNDDDALPRDNTNSDQIMDAEVSDKADSASESNTVSPVTRAKRARVSLFRVDENKQEILSRKRTRFAKKQDEESNSESDDFAAGAEPEESDNQSLVSSSTAGSQSQSIPTRGRLTVRNRGKASTLVVPVRRSTRSTASNASSQLKSSQEYNSSTASTPTRRGRGKRSAATAPNSTSSRGSRTVTRTRNK